MSKVFLTGATGFIGNNLVTLLLNRGFQVKVLVRNKKLLELFDWKDKVETVWGDILEPDSFKGKFNDCETVIHSAAIISFWNRIWDTIYKINVIGTKNIIDEAIRVNPKKFIHISSVAAIGFGENNEPINEDHPYNWNKFNISYMETKYEAEKEVYKGIEKGLNATIVNPANVWGIGDIRGRRVPIIKVIKLGFPFYVDAGTNFVDVDAVCEAIVNAIELGKCGERYILGGDNLLVKDFLGTIAREVKVKEPFILIPKFPITAYTYLQEAIGFITGINPKPTVSQLPLLGPKVFYDSSKAIKELKMPVIHFDECINKTVEYYRKNKMLR